MSTTRQVYDTNYYVDIDGIVYATTKTGKLRKIKQTLIENKSNDDYLSVVLTISSADNDTKRSRFAVKKLVADHFPIKIRPSKLSNISDEAEQLTDVQHFDIHHIDGDLYNCAAENLYYCMIGSKSETAGKPSQAALYRSINDNEIQSEFAEYEERPAVDVLGYIATTDGRILSNLRKNQVEIRPFFNNEHDKHLSVMLTIATGEKHRFCLPDLIIRTFRKDAKLLEKLSYKIFYRDGNNRNCAITNLIAAYKLPDSDTRAIRRQQVGQSEEEAKLTLASNGVIEN